MFCQKNRGSLLVEFDSRIVPDAPAISQFAVGLLASNRLSATSPYEARPSVSRWLTHTQRPVSRNRRAFRLLDHAYAAEQLRPQNRFGSSQDFAERPTKIRIQSSESLGSPDQRAVTTGIEPPTRALALRPPVPIAATVRGRWANRRASYR